MDYRDFVEEVEARGQFETGKEAENVTRAVFEVLAERLSDDQADSIAALLPAKLNEYLKKGKKAPAPEPDEFLTILMRKEGVDLTIAGYHARAVLSVLASAMPAHEVMEILSGLPRDIRDLFMVESWVKQDKC